MRTYCLLAAAAGWFALVLVYGVSYGGMTGAALLAGTANYLSFFTVLSNIAAAAVLTAAGLGARGAFGRLTAAPAVAGAIALYMSVTGIVYTAILRHIWKPEGLLFVGDALLHYVAPVLYLVYWLLAVPKGTLGLRHPLYWLAFPLIYAGYTLVRGPWAGFYPYPFLDASALGYGQVAVNVAMMLAGFLALGLLLLLVDRMFGRRGTRQSSAS